MKKLIQRNASHPGEVLLRLFMEPVNLNMTDLAKKMGVPRPILSAVIKGSADITPMIAAKLGKVFKTGAQLWLNMQTNYELSQEMKRKEAAEKTKKAKATA